MSRRGDFAEQYPGIAERLGGLVRERSDPMISGLLEGSAFLAARVQLKLKHEFPEFTANLLEQLVPNYLAPTPSAMLVKALPPYSDPALRDGKKIARGAYFDATYRERERSIACRFRLCRDIVLWPFDVTGAEYFSSAGALPALGIPVGGEAIAGLRLSLTHRTAARLDEERRMPRPGPNRRSGLPAARPPNCRSILPARSPMPSRFTSRFSPTASASISAISTTSATPW